MSVRRFFRSLSFRMYLFLCAVLLGMFLLMLVGSVSAIGMLRAEICSTAQKLLVVSQRRLEDVFSGMSSYLAALTYENPNVVGLERSDPDGTDYYVAMARMKRQLDNAVYATLADDFFYYHPRSGLFVSNAKGLLNPVGAETLEEKGLARYSRSWTYLNVDGEGLLLRAVRLSDSYVGAWVRVETALKHIESDVVAGGAVYLLDADGAFLSDGMRGAQRLAVTEGASFVTLAGRRYAAVFQAARFGPFHLAALLPDSSIVDRLQGLVLGVAVVLLLALALVSFGTALIRRWILRPVRELTTAIRALQDGDFSVTLPQNTYDEFQLVNLAFNEATERIERLKIGVYEERLRVQKIRMQYLQAQIAPHFLINCLNTVYQLADASRPEIMKRMLSALSEHLRYTLQPNETVSLGDELSHVRNYAALCAIRYPGGVALAEDCEPDALDAAVLPLMALSFVENAVKYEVEPGRLLTVHVEARLARDRQSVLLCVWDNGSGFSQEILDALQDIPTYLTRYGERHIGISNILQRADILFPGCVFAFSNRPDAGARIDMTIPYRAYGEGGRALEAVGRG